MRYLDIKVDNALETAEKTDVWAHYDCPRPPQRIEERPQATSPTQVSCNEGRKGKAPATYSSSNSL